MMNTNRYMTQIVNGKVDPDLRATNWMPLPRYQSRRTRNSMERFNGVLIVIGLLTGTTIVLACAVAYVYALARWMM